MMKSMFIFVFISFFAFELALAVEVEGDIVRDERCSSNNNDDVMNFLSHERDCRLFYICDHGYRALMKCPGDLVWNSELNVCDYAFNVKCFLLAGSEVEPNSESYEESSQSESSESIEIIPEAFNTNGELEAKAFDDYYDQPIISERK